MTHKDPEVRREYHKRYQREARNAKRLAEGKGLPKQYRYGTYTRAQRRKSYEYGLSIERYDEMIRAQSNRCAICGRTPEDQSGRALGIDHDHRCCSETARSCGRCVRGLLCSSCNQALGKFGDSISTLESAIAYLAKYGVPD